MDDPSYESSEEKDKSLDEGASEENEISEEYIEPNKEN